MRDVGFSGNKLTVERAPLEVPRIIVLMATFNGDQWLRQQIESIRNQRDVQLTLVVSDDGSTDQTVEILTEFAATFPSMQLRIAQQPSGSAARNFFKLIEAVDVRAYDYVALADQDDIWHVDKLARGATKLCAVGAAGYSASVRAFWPDGKTANLAQRHVVTPADYLFEGAGQGCTFILEARAFADIQQILIRHRELLRYVHYHDWTLYATCRARGMAWAFDDWECMRYRQHSTNDTGARRGLTGAFMRLSRIRSGWYAKQVELIAGLCVAIATDAERVAADYLRCKEAAEHHWLGRFELAFFVLGAGRRRWSDRLILVAAALGGYLSRAEPKASERRG